MASASAYGESYDDRRNRLIDNVYDGSDGFWSEPTSFILVGSSLHTLPFAEMACEGLSAEHDLVLVFDPEDMSAACFGDVEHLDILKSFFPLVKKLP